MGKISEPPASPTLLLIRQRHQENRVSEGWTKDRVKRLAAMWNLTVIELAAVVNSALRPASNGAQALLLTLMERHGSLMLLGREDSSLPNLFPFAEVAALKTALVERELVKAQVEAQVVEAQQQRLLQRKAMATTIKLAREKAKARERELKLERRNKRKATFSPPPPRPRVILTGFKSVQLLHELQMQQKQAQAQP